jgi:hypothetical protein
VEERYYAGAYWGPRRETAAECARRAELFFHMLARELPGYPVHPEVKELEELFLRGRNRTDFGKRVIEELGSSFSVWNAKKGSSDIHFHCGAWSPHTSNVCVLSPPSEGAISERLHSAPVLAEVLTCMVKAWDPDFAVATSHPMGRLVRKHEREVDVGWLTYLSRRLGRVPPLPAPVRMERVGTLGMLLVLTPERMTASNPEHVALATRVLELLARAGLLHPPPP